MGLSAQFISCAYQGIRFQGDQIDIRFRCGSDLHRIHSRAGHIQHGIGFEKKLRRKDIRLVFHTGGHIVQSEFMQGVFGGKDTVELIMSQFMGTNHSACLLV